MRGSLGGPRLAASATILIAILGTANLSWWPNVFGSNTGATSDKQTISYLKAIRPILAQHCFQCHGPDEASRKGKLRLDHKDDALAKRENKQAIAPSDLARSLVWERISSEEENHRMPPEGKQPLSKQQIDTLKTWIEQGATWEEHWSFV